MYNVYVVYLKKNVYVVIQKKNWGTRRVVVDCSGTSNPKFYLDLLIFCQAQGKTRPQKTPNVLKKGLKSAKTFFFTFLKVSPETKFVPYFG